MKNRVGKKKNRIRKELSALGIDVDNIEYSCESDKLPTKRISFAMLRHFAKSKGYRSGWAMAQFKTIYLEWPNRKWNSDPLIIPNSALKEYIYASACAYMESKNDRDS